MDKTRLTYDQFAATYDRINGVMPEGLALATERFLNRLPQSPHIVDVGCGTGRDMAWLEARGATLTGVDFSTEMLALARTRVRGELVQADMRELTLEDSSFDGLWCNAALLHLPKQDVPQILAHFKRVLVESGLAFFSLQVGAEEAFEETPLYPGAERFFARYQPDEFSGLLEANGFSVLEQEVSDAGVRVWLRVLARAKP